MTNMTLWTMPTTTRLLRSLTSYQQLMLNRLAEGRVVVLGGKECQRSMG